MPKPTPTPTFIGLKETTTKAAGSILLSPAPTDAHVTAICTGADGRVIVSAVIATRLVSRHLTEDEINELPEFPPSVREKARKFGRIQEVQEIGRTDGKTPLSVRKDDHVRITVESIEATPVPPGAFAGSLEIAGSTWDSVSVPLVLLVGEPSFSPNLQPLSISRSGPPGHSIEQDLVIAPPIRVAGSMIAWVEGDPSIMRVSQIIVFTRVHKQFTKDEIAELPAFPPSIRENARRNGYFEHQAAARGDGRTPLPVAGNQFVRLFVEFVTELTGFPARSVGTLFVDATTWTRQAVPLAFSVEQVDVTMPQQVLRTRQGQTATIFATFVSVAGGDTDLHLTLGMSSRGAWRVTPDAVHLPTGATIDVPLQIIVASDAPTGIFSVGLQVRGSDDFNFHVSPLALAVDPGTISVDPAQNAIRCVQGESVNCDFRITNEAGFKNVTLMPGTLPDGVHTAGRTVEIGPAAGTTTVRFTISVDRFAIPRESAWIPLTWRTDDGVGSATSVELTIDAILEERTFREEITTPAGTALGGWAEITIRSDGTSVFRGHLHDSGFDPYSFRVTVVVRGTTSSVTAAKSGHVAGTIGSGSRDSDWEEANPPNLILRILWTEFRNATATFSKSYEDKGVLGTLEDIAVAFGEFFVGAVVVNPVVSAIVVVGSELGKVADLPFAHPSLLAGVAVAGGMIFLFGPGVILPALVAGGIAAAQVKTRRIRPEEEAEARLVFADSLPFHRILLTNLSRGDRAFTVSHVDGSILVNLGGVNDGMTTRFDAPLSNRDWSATLIHELTHAWQIEHKTTIAELEWDSARNEFRSDQNVYHNFVADGRPWSKFEVEEQAQLVEDWYLAASASRMTSDKTLDTLSSTALPAFAYINNNVRAGEP